MVKARHFKQLSGRKELTPSYHASYGVGMGRGCTQFVHGRRRVNLETLTSLLCRDGARRVFTDQTGIACTKREAP